MGATSQYVREFFFKHRSAKRRDPGGQQRRNSHEITGGYTACGSVVETLFDEAVDHRKGKNRWSGDYRNGQTDTFTHVLAVPVDYKPKA